MAFMIAQHLHSVLLAEYWVPGTERVEDGDYGCTEYALFLDYCTVSYSTVARSVG